MCIETPGVPPLLPAAERGPTDRIPPEELTPIGGSSAAWVSAPDIDDASATPIVVVCHERYGVVRHTIELADRFARAGFIAIAPDFYADAALTGEEERLPHVPDDVVLRHLDAAIAHTFTLPAALPESPVAVIGICRTGSYGILASASRTDISAVVMLYGGAQKREFQTGELRPTPYERLLAGSDVPVLGLWGECDHTMSVDDVRRVRDLLEMAHRSYDFTIYADMPHGWLNDTMPGRFHPSQADEAFQSVVAWLQKTFRAGRSERRTISWHFRSRISTDYDFTKNERMH
jgi:carboxymethylenebutenolidase